MTNPVSASPESGLTLVTGATGFVGAAVARALVHAGRPIRLLHRAHSDLSNLRDLPGERVIADLTDPSSLAKAVAGCSALFHVAADYRLWVPDIAVMRRTNIDGSIALFEAAHAAGVKRMVYTSSVAALGLGRDGVPADEDTPNQPDDHIGPYKRSKYDAEIAVRRLAETGLDIVIVNPSAPVGPGDVKPTPTGRMVLDAARGLMPAYVETGMNIVHVDDVATGHLLAERHGKTGSSYILGGENLMLSDIGRMIADLAGRAPPRIKLPIGPLVPIAALMEGVARLTGHPPMMTRDMLAMARHRMWYSSARAIRELGYAPRPAQRAFEDALVDFCKRRLLATIAFHPAEP